MKVIRNMEEFIDLKRGGGESRMNRQAHTNSSTVKAIFANLKGESRLSRVGLLCGRING